MYTDFHRKRKLTAVLENENDNESTCTRKNARKVYYTMSLILFDMARI